MGFWLSKSKFVFQKQELEIKNVAAGTLQRCNFGTTCWRASELLLLSRMTEGNMVMFPSELSTKPAVSRNEV